MSEREIAESHEAFDAWYYGREGYALRAERLDAPKAELEAAFRAGQANVALQAARCADIYENGGGARNAGAASALRQFSVDIAHMASIRQGSPK